MAKSKSGKDLHAQAKDLISELPDETASGRQVDDNGSPMGDDQFAKDKTAPPQGCWWNQVVKDKQFQTPDSQRHCL